MSQPQDPSTQAKQANASSVDVENELNAVKNFSFIGVCVFLAFLVLLFSFETSKIPLTHPLRPAPDLDSDKLQEFQVKSASWDKTRLQTRQAAVDNYLSGAEAVVVASNLGLSSLTMSDAGLAVQVAPPADTAAGKAGLQVGDILRSIGGIAVKSPASYQEALEALVGTEDVRFEFLRGGNAKSGQGVYMETYQPLELHHAAEELTAAVVELSTRHWSVIKREEANKTEQIVLAEEKLTREEARKASGEDNATLIKGIKANLEEIEARFLKRRAALLQARDLELIGKTDLIASKYHLSTTVSTMTLVQKEMKDDKWLIVDSDQTAGSLVGGVRASEDGYWGQRTSGEVEFDSWRRHKRGAEQKVQNKKYAEYAQVAGSIMNEYFGSPDKPVFKGQTEISEATLAQGAAFYREHCSHCHGMSGYGDGPTAPFLNPRPRNYTFGKFKLRTNKSPKPTIDDLVHTLKIGMQGSMMPPFVLYKDTDLRATAAYVKYLSVRGETEWFIYNAFVRSYDNGGAASYLGDWEYNAEENTIDELVDQKKISRAITESFPRYLNSVLVKWDQSNPPMSDDKREELEAQEPKEPDNLDELPKAQRKAFAKAVRLHEAMIALDDSRKTNVILVEGQPVKPSSEAFEASLRRGQKLFIQNCKECHGWDGTGGGEKSDGMKDEWGLKPEWGYPIAPRNLTRGIYRGGGRPIDIYYRVSGGITGSGMPLSELTSEERWDLVNFVKSLAKTKQLKD